jgi:hypothetical protein
MYNISCTNIEGLTMPTSAKPSDSRLVSSPAASVAPQVNSNGAEQPGLPEYRAVPDDYPPDLMAEYDLLIDKKLSGTLPTLEQCRLDEIRVSINEIDIHRLRPDTWDLMEEKLRGEIEALRHEVDALPDLDTAKTMIMKPTGSSIRTELSPRVLQLENTRKRD